MYDATVDVNARYTFLLPVASSSLLKFEILIPSLIVALVLGVVSGSPKIVRRTFVMADLALFTSK